MLTTVFAVWMLLFAGTAPAAGHAAVIDGDPAEGSRIAAATRSVTLTFSWALPWAR